MPMEGEHPLETPWTFWYDKKSYKKTSTGVFYNKLRKLCTFSTIEEFWAVYCHLKRPSSIEGNVNLYLFRDGPNIVPMWEAFPRGGCWLLKIRKKSANEGGAPSILGTIWHDLVLALIGEAFEEPTVVGLSLAIRKMEDVVCLWNADNRNVDIQMKIGSKLREVLNLEPSTVIEYKAHADSLNDLSTFRNTKAYVFAARPESVQQPGRKEET